MVSNDRTKLVTAIFCWMTKTGVYMCRSPFICSFLFLQQCFVKWKVSGRTLVVLLGLFSKICSEKRATLMTKPLKLVKQFIYLGRNISSTESYINIHIRKIRTAIDRFTTIWKFDLSEKKMEIFVRYGHVMLMYGCTTWNFIKCLEE